MKDLLFGIEGVSPDEESLICPQCKSMNFFTKGKRNRNGLVTRLDAGQLAAKCNVQEKTEHMALREHHGTHNFKKEYIQSTARHYLLLNFVEI